MDKQKYTGINSEGVPEAPLPSADQEAFWEGRLSRLISDIHRNVSHIGFNDVVRVTVAPHGGLIVQSIGTNRAYQIPSYRSDRDVAGSNPRMCAESPKSPWAETPTAYQWMLDDASRAQRDRHNADVARLSKELDGKSEELKSAYEELRVLRAELRSRGKGLDQLQRIVDDLRTANHSLNDQIRDMRDAGPVRSVAESAVKPKHVHHVSGCTITGDTKERLDALLLKLAEHAELRVGNDKMKIDIQRAEHNSDMRGQRLERMRRVVAALMDVIDE